MGILPDVQQCLNCGNKMRHSKQGKTWYWICTRRVNGNKFNNGNFSVRRGTFLDHSKISIQTFLRVMWNFIHHLNEAQCKQYAGISTKTKHTVVELYCDLRSICNHEIWDPAHTPKLGGFGKIVETDESYFPGCPKYNLVRRAGTTGTEDEK